MPTTTPNPFWQLPVAPQPPNDPTWYPLNALVGWHAASLNAVTANGSLSLDIVPGTGRLLDEPSGSFGGLTPPGNVALEPGINIFLLDAASGKLKRFDPCDCRFDIVPCLGGIGGGPREVRDPHGIGICSGNLFVCDTGNHRLLVIALHGFVLRDIWKPPASAGLHAEWQPYSVAFDARGRVYVSDPANSCIHRFHPGGTWEAALPGFANVRWIAFDCDNRLYAVFAGQSGVRIFDREGKSLGAATRPDELAGRFPALPFKVDARGGLDLRGVCTNCVCSGAFDGAGQPLAAPPPGPLVSFAASGTYWSEGLDSDFYRCQWHRIVLRGQVFRKTLAYISTYTTEIEQTIADVQALPENAWQTNLSVTEMCGETDGLIFSGPGRYLWLRLRLSGNGSATPSIESVRLEFPRVSLRRYLPAVFAEDPGGADFTDRFLSIFDTTFRGIEKKIDRQAALFDPCSTPAKPAGKAGIDFLTWLAGWIGVTLDRQSPVCLRRQALREAGRQLCMRGTRWGLWKQLLVLLGMQPEKICCRHDQPKLACVPKPLNCAPAEKKPCAWQPPPLILEHYQLRRWMFLGQGRLGDDAVLWGRRIVNRSQLSDNAQAGVTRLLTTPDPLHDPFLVFSHKFTVFVPACWGESDRRKRSLLNLLESEKPAHTQYQVEYVAPRMRIGFQSMIGLDTVIARYPSGFRVGQALGKDSVLSGTPARGGPSYAIGRTSRIGRSGKLD